MMWLHWLFALAGALCCLAYVCRFDLLVARRHRLDLVALHLGLGTGAFAAMVNGALQIADFQDVGALMAAVAWIMVSADEWAGGVVPPAAHSGHGELDGPATLSSTDMAMPSGGIRPPGAPQP